MKISEYNSAIKAVNMIRDSLKDLESSHFRASERKAMMNLIAAGMLLEQNAETALNRDKKLANAILQLGRILQGL